MRISRLFLVTLIGTAASAAPALANEDANADRLDPCLKSINLIGASMGHVEKTGADGKSMLHFIVRSNGAEYDVACETDTGLVKDVSAHVRTRAEEAAN
jgi:hypothetical protein